MQSGKEPWLLHAAGRNPPVEWEGTLANLRSPGPLNVDLNEYGVTEFFVVVVVAAGVFLYRRLAEGGGGGELPTS